MASFLGSTSGLAVGCGTVGLINLAYLALATFVAIGRL